MRAPLLWLLCVAFAACFAGELDITGKACPCPNGWTCHPVRGCEPGDGPSAGGGGNAGGGNLGGESAGGAMTGGGGAADCPDADMDGVTVCDGDCDDADRLVYPAAPEVCGDLVANDCGSDADPASLCMGLGTFVADVAGCDDASPGTKEQPLCSINQGLSNATIIGNSVDVYVAAGLYPEDVLVSDGHSLFGGYCCSQLPCSWNHDVVACSSNIQSPSPAGVQFGAGVTRDTLLDGFRVVGVSNGDPTNAITLQQASPTISNNTIEGGDVTTSDITHAVWVQAGSTNDAGGALIVDNRIELGEGDGTNIGVRIEAAVEIVGNDISGGNGRFVYSIDAINDAPIVIRGNDIDGGAAVNGAAHVIRLNDADDVTIDGNRINTGANPGSCGGSQPRWCAGIDMLVSTATVVNNHIIGMSADGGVAIFMHESDGPEPNGPSVINANVLSGGVSTFPTISAAIALRSPFVGKDTVASRIRNNILLGGQGQLRAGIYEDSDAGATLKPETIEHNDFFEVDVAYRSWENSAGTNHTVAALNALMLAQLNFADDCLLMNGHELPSNSPCVDAGTETEAPTTDIDGEARPQGNGVDVGADEVR